MIVMFTDFGVNGPYLGQMEVAICQVHTNARVINLFANAPGFNPHASAYLLAAYSHGVTAGAVFLAVVDPGVGSEQREPVVVTVGDTRFVGPDNGLFDVVASRAVGATKQIIRWQPKQLSASFHGRDLFAPVAAHLDQGGVPDGWLDPAQPYTPSKVAPDLYEVIYIDDYGNAITGIRAAQIPTTAVIRVNAVLLSHARTFADVAPGRPFWYENSNGLVELAVNCGSVAQQLALAVGTTLEIVGQT